MKNSMIIMLVLLSMNISCTMQQSGPLRLAKDTSVWELSNFSQSALNGSEMVGYVSVKTITAEQYKIRYRYYKWNENISFTYPLADIMRQEGEDEICEFQRRLRKVIHDAQLLEQCSHIEVRHMQYPTKFSYPLNRGYIRAEYATIMVQRLLGNVCTFEHVLKHRFEELSPLIVLARRIWSGFDGKNHDVDFNKMAEEDCIKEKKRVRVALKRYMRIFNNKNVSGDIVSVIMTYLPPYDHIIYQYASTMILPECTFSRRKRLPGFYDYGTSIL